MPPPSQLSIATSAVTRLLKEETTYRSELRTQEARLQQQMQNSSAGNGVADDDGNREFSLRQQRTSIEETKAVFAPLRERIVASVERLETVLADTSDDADSKEVEAAREALGRAKESS